MSQKTILFLSAAAVIVFLMTIGCSSLERKLLFFPTHRDADGQLSPWLKDGHVIGYTHRVASPKNVWLMLHGNGGQAADRVYALPCFSPDDSVYILEYPGYGSREGTPSSRSLNQAAMEAYQLLRATYPQTPICVVSESLGCGPASVLASGERPPDKVVLILPFDQLSLVAQDHYPAVVVSMLLHDNWDNVATLSKYHGPVEIFGARDDEIIPVAHAKALAAAVPTAKFILIDGGHNEWATPGRVTIRNP
ncbi:MAG: alpha/beta hydrolase [Opitutaceae bacterium]